MKFKFSEKLIIDSQVEPWKSEGIRIGFYSAPGTRKSYTVAACIVERFLEEGGTVVVFEPRSEWHTLKEKWGSVVVAGGPLQDVAIATNMARVYAEAIVNDGVSMVFDFSETEEQDLVRFAAELLARIFTLQNVVRRPLLLVIEEAADYTPLSAKGKLVEPWIYDRMKARIVKIATQGRPLGFMIAIVSQRPAQLDFTVRMMCNLSFYGKFHPKDLNDVKQVLSAYDLPMPTKEMAEKCVNMPHGSWIAITSEGVNYLTIDVKRITPHGADTPKLEYVAPQTAETKKAVTNLVENIQKALEQERLEESELEKEKRKTRKLEEETESLKKDVDRLNTALEVAGKIKIEPAQKETPPPEPLVDKVKPFLQSLKIELMETFDKEVEHFVGAPKVVVQPQKSELTSIYEVWAPKLPSVAAKRILKLLVDNAGVKLTKSEIAVKLGYKASGGTFTGALSTLKRNSLVKFDGQLYWCE